MSAPMLNGCRVQFTERAGVVSVAAFFVVVRYPTR